MAEAITALGAAASIAQLTEYGITLIATTQEYYKSAIGATDENIALERVIRRIKEMNEDIQEKYLSKKNHSKRSHSKAEEEIIGLARESQPLCEDLLELLEDLRIPKDTSFRKLASLRQAIRASGKKKEIDVLEQKLRKLQGEVTVFMLQSIQDETYGLHAAIRRLEEATEQRDTSGFEKLRADIKKDYKLHHEGLRRSFSIRVAEVADEAKKMKRREAVLKSLCFERMNQRHSDISTAHAKTFAWILDEGKTDLTFLKWLRSSSMRSIYWISGKAGSGKSTLMKYIWSQERTLKALRLWTGQNHNLVVANYYFWNAGLPAQKSLKGLLQSLLYQVLRACPDMIEELCADIITDGWETELLLKLLQKLIIRSSLPAKFCFFIDGLDEFEGDESEIVDLLLNSFDSPNIKFCVSSRPWTVFLKAFGDNDQKIFIEKLTINDMKLYVKNILSENELFRGLTQTDQRCLSLIPQIAEKANGVWLWVYLVVRDLVRDLKRDEGYEILQRRLDTFPPELEEYFRATLRRIDSIYRKRTAHIFLATVHAVKPLPVVALQYLETDFEDSADEGSSSNDEFNSTEEMTLTWSHRLNNRCKDLLEVRFHPPNKQTEVTSDVSESQPEAISAIERLNYKVDFLHRTVRDFLRDNYRAELLEQAGEDFSVEATLCRIILRILRDVSVPEFQNVKALNFLFGQVDEFGVYAQELEHLHRSVSANKPLQSTQKLLDLNYIDLLDSLDSVMSSHAKNERSHWTNARTRPKINHEPYQEFGYHSFLAFAVQLKLRVYVTQKLDNDPQVLQNKRGRPLLDYALRPARIIPEDFPYRILRETADIDVAMVSLILERGADPNKKILVYDEKPVWGIFLLSCYEKSKSRALVSDEKKTWYEATKLLIDKGADPKFRSPRLRGRNIGLLVAEEGEYLSVSDLLQEIFDSTQIESLEHRMAEVAEERAQKNRWTSWKFPVSYFSSWQSGGHDDFDGDLIHEITMSAC